MKNEALAAGSLSETKVTGVLHTRFPDGPPLKDPGVPSVIVMCGPAGGGKSTFGRALAEHMTATGQHCTLLDVDEVRQQVASEIPHEESPDPTAQARADFYFGAQVTIATYQRMDVLAIQAASEGNNVIYVGNPMSPAERAKGALIAPHRPDVQSAVVWIDTPLELALARAKDPTDSTRPFAGWLHPVVGEHGEGYTATFEKPSDNVTEAYVRLQGGAWSPQDVAATLACLRGDVGITPVV